MSFSLDVKSDLIKVNNPDLVSNKMELEALLRAQAEIIFGRPMKLSFSSNSMGIVRRMISLCKKFYTVEYEIISRTVNRLNKGTVFVCTITDGADDIIKDMDLFQSESSLRAEVLENPQAFTAYLRGAFLAKGSVNDPASGESHLEIMSSSEAEILYLQKLMNFFELNARITKRKSNLVVYLKASEAISDFLYRIGAAGIMNYYQNAIIARELKANAKRTTNLEIANQTKTNEAALEQIKYIRYLKYNYPLEKMDPKILMAMKVREENPEASLTELLEVIHNVYDPTLTKSGLNHRYRKIKELALTEQAKSKKRSAIIKDNDNNN